MNSHSTLIQAKNLSKTIQAPGGELHILSDVNLSLAAGDAVAILGASGSGKSTLLGLLAGLDEPSSGDIILFGQSLSALNEDQRAALRAGQVGFIFQSFQLLPGMTALENVMLPLELIGNKQPKKEAEDALERVSLSARLHHFPNQLSGGEQQRVAIARAFATKPKLLFADEPTGSLDTTTGTQVLDLLFQLRAQYHSALLLVTHDEKMAQRCDRRLLLVDGQLNAS